MAKRTRKPAKPATRGSAAALAALRAQVKRVNVRDAGPAVEELIKSLRQQRKLSVEQLTRPATI